MPAERIPSLDATDAAPVGELAAIDSLATLDNRLAGHSSDAADSGRPGHDPSAANAESDSPDITAAIDTILLLRQVAAAERDAGYEPLVLPQRIGRYEIVREAGRGAFAYVLETRDELLHRQVALKVARPEALVSAAFRRRFIREAELAARLTHPHIVTIHEVGEEAGLVFIASEYCAGGDLADWLERHPEPMAPRQAAVLVRALASAVAHAHASGIVHRDIKPANVLLVPPPDLPQLPRSSGDASIADMCAKLGDFGLAKLFRNQESGKLTQLTRTGTRLGTPAWMAPEQIDRTLGDVGPPTDIHALGLLLDRLITGRCLYGGKTEAEIYRAVLLEEPAAADSVVRNVPRDLAAVCLRCLAKRPADRYASAADLAAELSRFLDDTPTLARPRSGLASMARSIARRPLLSLLATVAAGGLLLALWATSERTREARRHAASQAERGRLEAATELRRGFEAWRTGNAAAAVDHLRACQTQDPGLAGSLAGRWLLARLHGEHDLLLAPADARAPRPDLYCVASNRDGRTIAAGGADGRLVILQFEPDGSMTGSPLVIAAHDEVNDVVFSPDGRQLASAGEDGRLCIWNVADGSLDREAYRSTGPLFAAAFSPSGDRLACGGGDQSVCLIPMAAGEMAREIKPFAKAIAEGSLAADSDIESMQFIDDDRIVIGCGRAVALLDIMQEGVRMLSGHAGTVGQVALSRDGTRLLSAGTDREPRVWDLATGRLLLTLPRHPSWVQGCDFSPDGTRIATGCRDGVVRIFDAATAQQERQMAGHVGRTWDVKYDASGMVLSAGADGTLRRWDLAAAPEALGMRDIPVGGRAAVADQNFIDRVAVSIVREATGGRSALLNLTERTVLINVATGILTSLTAASSTAPSCSIDIDEIRRRFAAVSWFGPIGIHPLPGPDAIQARSEEATAFRVLPGMEDVRGKDVTWTASGTLIAGCTGGPAGGRLMAWNAALDQVAVVDRLERTVDAVRLAPAGPARLAIAAGKRVRVYPLAASGLPTVSAAKTLFTLPTDTGIVVKLAWSPDGQRLAYGTDDGRVATIDTASGETLSTFPKHAREVTGMAWSTDGRTLVTADAECVRFADVATTTMFDEVRPGWNIENMDFADDGDDAGPLLVIVGSAAKAATASGGSDRTTHVGIFDLHRSPPPTRVLP